MSGTMFCTAANALWLAGTLREAAAFRRAVRRVRDEQHALLMRLLRANAATAFGREHAFATVRSTGDFQCRVPMRTYDEYAPYIERAADGEPGVLTQDSVRLFEPTSGSASATKLIPYTRGFQRQFQAAIDTWVADLYLSDPDLMHGRSYWSITPAMHRPRRTAGGIPIGFADDAEYLGGWRRRLAGAAMVRPGLQVASERDAFHRETLIALAACGDLRILSVWNPTFLTVLLDKLPVFADAILAALGSRSRRAAAVRAALGAATAGERHAMLWPHLRLVSCWADAHAAAPAAELRRLFPHARLQPKGLIATEGFVSFPLTGREGSALAIRSHFFEFAPDGDSDRALLAHEIEAGARYEVILSSAGGLYRYRLGDLIEVVGHAGECPLIRFIGRRAYVSDWFGEKLSEAHAAQVLREAFAAEHVAASFAMLACDSELAPPAYVLYVETAACDGAIARVAARADDGLRANFHYDYARRLGQLGQVRPYRVRAAGETYLRTAIAAGQRAGNVKPVALHRHDGWSRRFEGSFVADSLATTPR